MTRLRLGVVLALAVAFGALCHAPQAMAAPEIHRLNMVISAIPSQLKGGGMNDLLTRYNEYPLADRGLEPIDRMSMGWTFDYGWSYFVRPNFAATWGVGMLKVESKREFLPSIGADINLRAEVIAAPIHLGAQYYFAPYTQGDFQARAYIGGGLLSIVSRAEFSTYESGLGAKPANPAIPGSSDTLQAVSLGGRNLVSASGVGPGFYLEAGVHLFFASRLSLMVGAIYRDMKLANLTSNGATIRVPQPDAIPEQSGLTLPMVLNDNSGRPLGFNRLDLSGAGIRASVAYGF